MKTKISGKDLLKLGFPQNNSVNVAMGIITRYRRKESKEIILSEALEVLNEPHKFESNRKWAKLVEYLKEPIKVRQHELRTTRAPFNIFGENEIDETAKRQLYDALKLPVALYGALMPDAHGGYGLPIGGVLATDNTVIPYGVGVDISCRMSLSIFDLPADFINGREDSIRKILDDNTKFGMSETHKIKGNAEVLDKSEFYEIPLLRQLHDKAYKQLGTSGGGNHFVEFGIVDIASNVNKVATAVRATHSASGLQVLAMDTRSQLQNKKLALERLKEKFIKMHYEKLEARESLDWLNQTAIERGKAIRTYEGLKFRASLLTT